MVRTQGNERPQPLGPTRDNWSHEPSEGRGRGSDLAVTAPELNAGAGVGRLGGYTYGRREVEEQLVKLRLTQKLTLILVVAFPAGQAISHSVGQP